MSSDFKIAEFTWSELICDMCNVIQCTMGRRTNTNVKTASKFAQNIGPVKFFALQLFS